MTNEKRDEASNLRTEPRPNRMRNGRGRSQDAITLSLMLAGGRVLAPFVGYSCRSSPYSSLVGSSLLSSPPKEGLRPDRREARRPDRRR